VVAWAHAGIIGGGDFGPGEARSGKTRTSAADDPSGFGEIFGGVDADTGCERAHVHRDAFAVPEHTQLLEPLDVFQRTVF
jgi:hypothetical protein